jgi:uncharacterized protein YqeY
MASTPLADALQEGLRDAMRRRDRTSISALRTALAAIANAEAVPLEPQARSTPVPSAPGPQEAPRLVLSDDEVATILRHEIEDRHDTIARFEAAGQHEAAEPLRDQVAVLEAYVT